jgi:hypothetical protein
VGSIRAFLGIATVEATSKPKWAMTIDRKAGSVWCAPLLLVIVASGCAPKITQFDVAPTHVCEGTPSLVTWAITGTPELTTDPAIQPLPGQPLRFQVTEDTVFTLRAKRWPEKPDVSQSEVRFHRTPPPVREPIVVKLTCEDSNLVGTLPRPATEWDPKIRLETVASDGSRDVDVDHERHHATLTVEAPSTDAFRGAPMAGDWKVTTPLRPYEHCGDPTSAPPSRIILTTQFVCANVP